MQDNKSLYTWEH